MRRSIVFAGSHTLASLRDLSQRAEALGFHRIWTTENHSRDGMLRAAVVAQSTTTIQVGTGIAYAFTRAPLAMAAEAAELQVLAGGRFTLGLGAMTRGMRVRWYGLTVEHPAPQLKEYVTFVRAALRAGKGFSFAGRFYRAEVPDFELVGDPAQIAALPIYGSGVNAAMLKACADSCDGIALHSVASALSYFDATVAPALARAKRTVGLAVWRITAVDEDREVARTAARRNVAFYLATPSYRAVGEGRPWQDRVARIQEAFRTATAPIDWRPLEALVTDEMLDELALAGTPASVRRDVVALEAEYEKRGIDELVFQTAETAMGAEGLRRNQALIIDALGPNRAANA